MHPPDSPRVQFEEAVAVGGVFSPALLTALPFISSVGASIAIAALLAVLLVSTLIGYFAYRKQVPAGSSFHLWRISLLLLLALAMLSVTAVLACGLGGSLAGVSVIALFLLLAAAAWRKMPRNRSQGEYKGSQTVASAAGVLGAVGAGVLAAVFGSALIHAVVATLHLSLAVIATVMLIRAVQEARASQNAA
jgi:hypothetical protein